MQQMKKSQLLGLSFKILPYIFYGVLTYSVFLKFEVKEQIVNYFIALLSIALLLVAIGKKSFFTNFILIFFFGLILITSLGNFIIDLIFQPTIPALDCDGALPMNGNWIRGSFLGIILCCIVIPFYIKNPIKKNLTEQILSGICLLLLLLTFCIPNTFKEIHTKITLTSKPTIIYPEDC
ncbi:hypothetical protein FCR2A7T_29770 [Flavobacterium cauense R2A-7]|nr:hypothetical protein FCR2A7T_29770 [Flavobacterium cauense R2A-7]KGO79442.1 hypothetical protein Q762_14150 [Flavobacterium cauense R2A-7]